MRQHRPVRPTLLKRGAQSPTQRASGHTSVPPGGSMQGPLGKVKQSWRLLVALKSEVVFVSTPSQPLTMALVARHAA